MSSRIQSWWGRRFCQINRLNRIRDPSSRRIMRYMSWHVMPIFFISLIHPEKKPKAGNIKASRKRANTSRVVRSRLIVCVLFLRGGFRRDDCSPSRVLRLGRRIMTTSKYSKDDDDDDDDDDSSINAVTRPSPRRPSTMKSKARERKDDDISYYY
eukprot:scaffold3823_cov195-Amphora_coffeaeformis.AAC.8